MDGLGVDRLRCGADDGFVGNRTTCGGPVYITAARSTVYRSAFPRSADYDVGDVELPPGTTFPSSPVSRVPRLIPERRLNYEYRMIRLDDDWNVADEARTIEYGRIPVGPLPVRGSGCRSSARGRPFARRLVR